MEAGHLLASGSSEVTEQKFRLAEGQDADYPEAYDACRHLLLLREQHRHNAHLGSARLRARFFNSDEPDVVGDVVLQYHTTRKPCLLLETTRAGGSEPGPSSPNYDRLQSKTQGGSASTGKAGKRQSARLVQRRHSDSDVSPSVIGALMALKKDTGHAGATRADEIATVEQHQGQEHQGPQQQEQEQPADEAGKNGDDDNEQDGDGQQVQHAPRNGSKEPKKLSQKCHELRDQYFRLTRNSPNYGDAFSACEHLLPEEPRSREIDLGSAKVTLIHPGQPPLEAQVPLRWYNPHAAIQLRVVDCRDETFKNMSTAGLRAGDQIQLSRFDDNQVEGTPHLRLEVIPQPDAKSSPPAGDQINRSSDPVGDTQPPLAKERRVLPSSRPQAGPSSQPAHNPVQDLPAQAGVQNPATHDGVPTDAVATEVPEAIEPPVAAAPVNPLQPPAGSAGHQDGVDPWNRPNILTPATHDGAAPEEHHVSETVPKYLREALQRFRDEEIEKVKKEKDAEINNLKEENEKLQNRVQRQRERARRAEANARELRNQLREVRNQIPVVVNQLQNHIPYEATPPREEESEEEDNQDAGPGPTGRGP